MRTIDVIAVVVISAGCSQQDASDTSRSASAPRAGTEAQSSDTSSTANSTPLVDPDQTAAATIKPLTPEQQERLLDARLDGGMSYSFSQFANMFMVSSRLHLGIGVGLMTSSPEIANSPLLSPFPPSYKPTFRELLDAIALQTFSEWKYDPTSKYFHSDVEHDQPVDDIALFEFAPSRRTKPFEVTLASGWKDIDKGNWVMHVPPSFPVGLDIYEMGTYSSDGTTTEREFQEKIETAVALQWAQRVNADAVQQDLQPAKVGAFDVLFYESMADSQLDQDIKWRQWVFMVDSRCYFIVSTILPEFESEIFPDVEKMLASFQVMRQ